MDKSYEPESALQKRPTWDTWAASPIDPYYNAKIRKMQLDVQNTILDRVDQSAEEMCLPDKLVSFIEGASLQRFQHEMQLNHVSIESARHAYGDDAPIYDIKQAYVHAINGDAMPSELLTIRERFNMPSVELGKISHVGAKGIEHLHTMRKKVSEEITSRGGLMYDQPEQQFRVDFTDATFLYSPASESGDSDGVKINYLTMKRKRVIGVLPDMTEIVEKSTFVLRVDEESPVDNQICQKIREIPSEYFVKIDQLQERLQAIPDINEFLDFLLTSNRYDVAIPINTTIYAKNEETIADIAAIEATQKREQSDPQLANLLRLARLSGCDLPDTAI